ncbi:MAG: hypothetical protein HY518_03110 [Candidatus Aenigmarchaeota archaeon]|nr:hypothetical protein [Candidatus Aenigmarchaeota archaeon]
MREPTIEDVVRAIQIYSDVPITRENIETSVSESVSSGAYRSVRDACIVYYAGHLGLPSSYIPEICALGRRLNQFELEALNLREKVRENGIADISINIKGLSD